MGFAVLSALTNQIISTPQSLYALFQFRAYTWQSNEGCAIILSEFATSLIMAAVIPFVVERAKKCLDFVATYHIFHFIAICWISGFPNTSHWWIVNGMALVVTTLLGEYLCMQGETKAIKLTPKT